ncbi:MAG: S-methyl-5-thioribose-1-phosphate isomerase [Candidatus Omnitrophota bacterium]
MEVRRDTIRFIDGVVEILDQRVLPGKVIYVKCRKADDIFDAISKMKIRGAPAIGIAGAFGVYLGAAASKASDLRGLKREVKKISSYLASSRPTARNLFWALERMENTCLALEAGSKKDVLGRLLAESLKILEEDKAICRAIGEAGNVLIKKGARILTHCNAGSLATGGYGTALGVIARAGKKIKMVYVDETRPVLQGARLTAWELSALGIPATLICDNAAAYLMSQGKIDAVIVGADRIAANGDTANKIGTYSLAVAAKYHDIPFYIAAPASTFDLSIPCGEHIPIEERPGDEVRKVMGKSITLKDMPVLNPAFDVTPRKLITAIITEFGVIERPSAAKIKPRFG